MVPKTYKEFKDYIGSHSDDFVLIKREPSSESKIHGTICHVFSSPHMESRVKLPSNSTYTIYTKSQLSDITKDCPRAEPCQNCEPLE